MGVGVRALAGGRNGVPSALSLLSLVLCAGVIVTYLTPPRAPSSGDPFLDRDPGERAGGAIMTDSFPRREERHLSSGWDGLAVFFFFQVFV